MGPLVKTCFLWVHFGDLAKSRSKNKWLISMSVSTVDLRIGFMLSSKPNEILAHSQSLLWRCVAAPFIHLEFLELFPLVKHSRKVSLLEKLTLAGNSFIFYADWHPCAWTRSEGIRWSYPSSCFCTGWSCGWLAIIRNWLFLPLVGSFNHKWEEVGGFIGIHSTSGVAHNNISSPYHHGICILLGSLKNCTDKWKIY